VTIKAASCKASLVLGAFVLCTLLSYVAVSATSTTATSAGGEDYLLTKSNDLYTLAAKDANVREVLDQVAKLSGVRIDVDSRLAEKLTLDVKDVTIDQLISAVSKSHSFTYAKNEEGEQLTDARVTSQQDDIKPEASILPVFKKAGDRTPEEDALLKARGVLSNTRKSVRDLSRGDSLAILLQNAMIDTELAARTGKSVEVPEEFRADPASECYIVQFKQTVSEADRRLLEENGAAISHYVPNYAFAVTIDPKKVDALRQLDRVQFVEPYHPYYKMSTAVLSYLTGSADEPIRKMVTNGVFNVMTFRGATAAEELKKLGAEIVNQQASEGRTVLAVKMEPSQLTQLIRNDSIQWVEPRLLAQPMNDVGAKKVRASGLRSLHPTLTGEGVIVGVTDTGIDFVNRGFALNQNQTSTTGVNSRIVHYAYREGVSSDGIPGDTYGHGTHVSGSILGNGANSLSVLKAPGSGIAPFGTNHFAGVAPGAKLVMIEDFNSFTFEEQAQIAYTKGARLSNNSWGNSFFEYGTMSAIWDGLVRDADSTLAGQQEYTAFFAAGNAGDGIDDGTGGIPSTVGEPGNAKNVITVGAVEQPRFADNLLNIAWVGSSGTVRVTNSEKETDSDWQVTYFSSRGPVGPADLRVKPDLVAPGAYVLSVQSHQTHPDDYEGDPPILNDDYRYGNVNSGTNFAFFSGTSMATPLAAGAGALAYQYFTNHFAVPPSPAMMKAMMVNGARMVNSLVYKYPIQSYDLDVVDQGWGMLDVQRAVDGAGIQNSDQNILIDQSQTTPLSLGQFYSYPITLEPGDGGLKITLAWTDVPGTPGNAIQLVNNLDLMVLAPGGGGYLGDVFSPDGVHSYKLESVDTIYADMFNNVETIVIPPGLPGTYTIRVYGHSVPQGPQDFALAIMKGIGIEGRTAGDSPAVALDANDKPVVVWAGNSADRYVTNKAVYLKKWVGSVGAPSDIGQWKRMDDQWFDVRGSTRGSGVSKLFEDSGYPSVAVHSQYMYVAWEQFPRAPETLTRIYLRQYNGSDWVELGNSGHDVGVSGVQTYNSSVPIVRVGADGNPVVAWKQQVVGTDGIRIYVAKWNAISNNWTGFANSHVTGITVSARANNIDMVLDQSGNPVVAWSRMSSPWSIETYRWTGSAWANLGAVTSEKFLDRPSLSVGAGGSIYRTWIRYPDTSAGEYYVQVFAQRYSGGWSAFGGSMTYPGVSASTNYILQPDCPTIAESFNGHVTVAWQAGTNVGNSILVRKFNGVSWSGVAGSDKAPGISQMGGRVLKPRLLVDSVGLPVVTFQNRNDASGLDEVVSYALVGDRTSPSFGGLQSAIGGTNGNVVLHWSNAVDNVSSTITYRVYRGANTWPCGITPACSETDVFSHVVAVVTNINTWTNNGLVNDRIYCFGVRAVDDADLFDRNTIIRSAGPVSGNGDTDGDCLSNLVEIAVGTEPCIADTDADGMKDGWEWFFSYDNPLHTNAVAMDPLDNGTINIRTGDWGQTNQMPGADMDSDGASNLEEYQWYLGHTNLCVTWTTNLLSPNPTLWDTDADGMPDGWEMMQGFNPVDPADAVLDADGDGLNNLQEYQWGTDPRYADSDSDGELDGMEVTNRLTNPSLSDTDLDGLDDGNELAIGADPRKADTKGSLAGDADMIQLGWNPTNSPPVLRVFLNANFETNSVSRTNWFSRAVNPALPFNLWHLSQAEPYPNTSGIAYQHERSTNTAFRFASDLKYGTNVLAGYTNGTIITALRAALESPQCQPTNSATLFVSWNENYDTEPNGDFVQVFARGGANTNWFPVSAAMSGKSGVEDNTQSNVPSRWVNRTLDISQFAGMSNVQVRFLFVANAINNFLHGWYVDDVMIYEGVKIAGWVRDIDGAPISGARVQALGRGGITNLIQGHRFVLPGKSFGEALTLSDGSYAISGLPQGRYFVKASEASHQAEFFNGRLFNGPYGFARQANPGVADVGLATNGWVDLTAPGSSITNAHFELEKGRGRSYLGVMFPNPAGLAYDIYVNGLSSNLQATVWDGVADTNKALNSFAAYRTSTNATLLNNYPDWITQARQPTLLGDLAPGDHWLFVGSNLTAFPPPVVNLREGEVTLVNVSTSQASGFLSVAAEDGKAYPIWLDGRSTTNLTPVSHWVLPAGLHEVRLVATNNLWIAPKTVSVPYGSRTTIRFATNETAGPTGGTFIRTVDIRGNAVSGAEIFIDGISVSHPSIDVTNLTPALVSDLRSGQHNVTLTLPGYRDTETRTINVFGGITNAFEFILYDADKDYDRVGDSVEVAGYTNIFRYDRNSDPDTDGLNSLLEFDQFRLYNVFLNPFNADTDGDLMMDGSELGYDGISNRLAFSTIETNVLQGASFVRSFFRGRYLEGIDNFGTGHVAVAIEGDRFISSDLTHPDLPMPSASKAVTVFMGVPSTVVDKSVTVGHNKGAVLYADALPNIVDTDNDGMWDGFEALYGLSTIAKLDPIEARLTAEDPDGDGLSNLSEFLGQDGQALTNNFDSTNPTAGDTDEDGMPDGWEVYYGFNPLNPSDAWFDPDNDGLPNYGEFYYGANPKLSDTDADYLPDGVEVLTYGTDPLDIDTDNDGLLDGREVWDRDMDGVRDGGFFPNWNGGDLDGDGYADGPTDWDTDGDGMPDGFEVIDAFGRLRNDSRLDPYNPNDGDDDPDGDGLSNLQEYLVRDSMFGNNMSGYVWDFSTDPFNPDSDGDGMPDGWEVLKGLHPMDPVPISYYNLDPLDQGGVDPTYIVTPYGVFVYRYTSVGVDGDNDGDGLWNLREYEVRFHLDPTASSNAIDSLSTDPWNPDTDEDGLGDGEEDRIFRSNPILQDSDTDRLMDGASVPGKWGEVESKLRRTEFQVVAACPTCTWEAVSASARIPHPMFNSITGHLAVMQMSDRLLYASDNFTPFMENIAFGGYYTNGAWHWLNDEYFWEVAPNPSGQVNYIVSDYFGALRTVTNEQSVDHYVVQWDNLPTVTNHYDQALNDLWRLVWPSKDDLPHWESVRPNSTGDVPAPRWGAAMSYIPVFETKNPRNDNSGTILLDNRQLVVIGGRDGVTKHSDVWEFSMKSNCWQKSKAPLTSVHPLYTSLAMSELSAVPLFTYGNTKEKDCGCTDVPYNCDGTSFLEPKNRPWSTSRSLDWTFLFGGWDNSHKYYLNHLFYKSTDDQVVEERNFVSQDGMESVETQVQVQGVTNVTTNITIKVGYNKQGELLFGGPYHEVSTTIAQGITTYVTNSFYGTNAFAFAELNGLGSICEKILSAQLEFELVDPVSTNIDIAMFTEFNSFGNEPGGWASLGDLFKTNGRYFNSMPLYTNIPQGSSGVVTVDVMRIVQEAYDYGRFGRESFGVVVYSTNLTGRTAKIRPQKTRLVISFKPSYADDPHWASPEITTTYYSQDVSDRKSSAVVYDFKRQKLVMFGGIDGRRVLGDTHEGEVSWKVSGDPDKLNWFQKVTASSPSPRWGHSMVYDGSNQRVVLFGGFDANHRPLNDLWIYREPTTDFTVTNVENGVTNVLNGTITNAAEWVQITGFQNKERPQPRGGASMIYYGDFDYNRGVGDYFVSANKQKIVLFGGTDGNAYFNDTWVLSSGATNRWILVNPTGPLSQGPSPRAFSSMVWAQNGRSSKDKTGRYTFRDTKDTEDEADDEGTVTLDLGDPRGAKPAAYLFGGRFGAMNTAYDTDFDMVSDGIEHELGGRAAGRDPRVNKLVQTNNATETVPYAFNKIGPIPRVTAYAWPFPLTLRGAVADMESLRNDDGEYAAKYDLPYEYFAEPDAVRRVQSGQFENGVEAEQEVQVDLWYHRYSIEDPFNTKDVWKRGVPNNSAVGSNGAPRYAHSGRWCYGTALDGNYPNSAMMELYSPLVQLTLPPSNATSTNNYNNYFLVFYEWLDLFDSNDVVRVEAVRPETPADINTHQSGLNKPVLPLLPNRSSAFNSRGNWRRVVVPLDNLANEQNVYFRFTLQSDATGVAGGWYIDDVALLQASEISGVMTNLFGVKVSLLGIHSNGEGVTNTVTDANGLFQFGLLPLGSYAFGVLSETNTSMFINSAVPPLDLEAILGGNSASIEWPAVPGCQYLVEYADTMVNGQWQWHVLDTVVANSSTATAQDASATPLRVYRVWLVTGL